MDPKGVYGIGIYQVQDEAEMRDLLKHENTGLITRTCAGYTGHASDASISVLPNLPEPGY